METAVTTDNGPHTFSIPVPFSFANNSASEGQHATYSEVFYVSEPQIVQLEIGNNAPWLLLGGKGLI